MQPTRLVKNFRKYSNAYPDLLKGTVPVRYDMSSLVVDCKDGTVLKLIERAEPSGYEEDSRLSKIYESARQAEQKHSEIEHANELVLLRALSDSDLPFPRLLEEPVSIAEGPAYAMMRMSRIAGGWLEIEDHPFESKSDNFRDRFIKGAAMLLAEFHRVAAPYKDQLIDPFECGEPDNRIPLVPGLGTNYEKALKKADDYLREHARAGVTLGGMAEYFWPILTRRGGKVTGLASMSAAVPTNNMYSEWKFRGNSKILRQFTTEYMAITGQKFDRYMLPLMDVSHTAYTLARMGKKGTTAADRFYALEREKLDVQLDQVTHITGQSFGTFTF